ncbi:MAG: hypothetical protein WBW04_13560 [Nitrolancea sp.]
MDARRAEGFALLALQVFATLSAIGGGFALANGTIDLPLDWLNGTIFSDYTIPGVILGAAVGGTQLIALFAIIGKRSTYLLLTGFAGGMLMGWIITELLIVGSNDLVMFGYQLFYFLVGFVEFAAASFELRQLARD